ncbi:MAG: hypothetical protein Q9224_006725, partial [Gallowayella concinna]
SSDSLSDNTPSANSSRGSPHSTEKLVASYGSTSTTGTRFVEYQYTSRKSNRRRIVSPFDRNIAYLVCGLSLGTILLLSLCCVQDPLRDPGSRAEVLHTEQACSSAHVWLLCSYTPCYAGGLRSWLMNITTAQPQESFGGMLADNFASMYGNLSETIVFANLLDQRLLSFIEKHSELRSMSLHLPPGSEAIAAVDQFRLVSEQTYLRLGMFCAHLELVGRSAENQYFATNKTLVMTLNSPAENTWLGYYAHAIGWMTPPERDVQRQLKSNIDALRGEYAAVFKEANETLSELTLLRHTAEEIVHLAKSDLARFKQEKVDWMEDHHPIQRLFVKAFGSLEAFKVSEVILFLTLVDELVLWIREEVSQFSMLFHHLKDAGENLNDLSHTLYGLGRSIRWGLDEEAKKQALNEFIRTTRYKFGLLRHNLKAGEQERRYRSERDRWRAPRAGTP